MESLRVTPSEVIEDVESKLAISSSQASLAAVGLGYILLSCWVRVSLGDP